MLRDSDLHDLKQGQIVYLTPHTKTASRACHQRQTVRIMHEKATILKHWPMVVVEWTKDGNQVWERVHRDNINLRPATASAKVEKREGDGPSSSGKPPKVRVLRRTMKPIDIPDGQEQGMLF